jgi:hypothetical protein
METNGIILAKLAIGLASLAGFMCLERTILEGGRQTRLFLGGAATWWLISRLGLFFTLFVIMGFDVPLDVSSAYYPWAKMALEGRIVYRDFYFTYGPLFPYIAGGALAIWDSPKAIVLLSIGFEALAIVLWYGAATHSQSASYTRMGLLLYLCNPLPILNIAVAGQNQIWTSCFLAAAFTLFLVKREFFSGFVIGFSVTAVKFLTLMFVPYWCLISKSKLNFLSGIILALAVCLLPFYWIGANVLQPLDQAERVTSGNLPYLLSLVGFDPSEPTTGLALILILIVTIVASSIFIYKHTRDENRESHSLLGLAVLLLIFMLFSKKAYTNYLNIGMFPICYSVAVVLYREWERMLFLVWCCIATLEPSLWHRWLSQASLRSIFHGVTESGMLSLKSFFFVLVELLLLGGYVILLWLIFGYIVGPRQSKP